MIESDRITAITVGYSYGSCSGLKTVADMNAEIIDLRTTPFAAPAEPYHFNTLIGPNSETDNTLIQGFSSSPSSSTWHGIVVFVRPGCGETGALWTATRR